MMLSNNPDRADACAACYGWTLLVLLGFTFYECYLLLAVPESPRMQVYLRLIPWLIIPYLVWGSIYAAFWADRYSACPARNRWLWSAVAGTLTLGLGVGFPGLLSVLIHYQGLTVFGGPAFLFFMAPVLTIFLIRLFDNLLGRKPL